MHRFAFYFEKIITSRQNFEKKASLIVVASQNFIFNLILRTEKLLTVKTSNNIIELRLRNGLDAHYI